MPTWTLILLSVLLFCSALMLGYWLAVGFHVARTVRTIPAARAGLGTPIARSDAELPGVCIIVPAHNEESCIALVARSILSLDYPRSKLSGVFALDRCTDRTDSLLRQTLGNDDRFETLTVSACPDGWAGKVNAIWSAVSRSPRPRNAEVLLFLDADTTLDPACLRAAVGLLKSRRLGMLSLLSTLSCQTWFERIVQGPATMELLRQFPIVRANSSDHKRPFANGQFILADRAAYERFGGHEAVRWAVLEDVELARQAGRHGVNVGVFIADGLLRCRMYANYAEFRRGWKRIFSESANRRSGRLLRNAWRTRLLGALLPAASAGGLAASMFHLPEPLAVATIFVSGAAISIWIGVVAWCYALGRTPLWCSILSPLGAWCVGSILIEAAGDLRRGRPTVWAGREYLQRAR